MTDMQAALQEFAKTSQLLGQSASALARRADDTADVGTLELRATAQDLRSSAEFLHARWSGCRPARGTGGAARHATRSGETRAEMNRFLLHRLSLRQALILLLVSTLTACVSFVPGGDAPAQVWSTS